MSNYNNDGYGKPQDTPLTPARHVDQQQQYQNYDYGQGYD
jgi:hypothetical protein